MSLLDTKAAALQILITGDSYGLEIIDKIAAGSTGMMLIAQGRLYPALRELEHEGLLESYEAEASPERGGRPRRYYRITAAGRKVAKEQAKAIRGLLKPALAGL